MSKRTSFFERIFTEEIANRLRKLIDGHDQLEEIIYYVHLENDEINQVYPEKKKGHLLDENAFKGRGVLIENIQNE